MTSTTKQSESLVTCNITGVCAVGGVFMVGVSSSHIVLRSTNEWYARKSKSATARKH